MGLPSTSILFCVVMNHYLMQLSLETRRELYGLLGNLQYPAFVGMLLLASVKYRVPVKHKVILWIAFAVSSVWGGNLIPLFGRLTHGMIPTPNMGIAFGLVMIILAAIVYFLRVPVLFSLDTAVPAYILGRGLAITGCIFFGCCYGYPAAWGIYSAVAETCVFPTVILDSVASCCIVIYLVVLARKQNYSGNGAVAAMGMLLFGILRVLVDVLRDNHKRFLLLTAEGLFGIAYIVAGVLLLRAILIRGEKNEVS